jgi:hypothetical protein
LVCFDKSVPPCDVQAGGLTLWVKRTDAVGARYAELENVDPRATVSKLIARWVVSEKLDVTPSLVSLRLVPCPCSSEEEPTPEQEAAATVLPPRKTLAEAGVVDGSWLLAVFAQAAPSAGVPFTRVVTACSRVSFVRCAMH